MTVKRPLVWISTALVGGTAFSSAFGPPFLPFLAAFALCLIVAVLLIILRKLAAAAVAVFLASFLLGNCIYLLEAYVREMPDPLAQHYASDAPVWATLYGTVSERRLEQDTRRAVFVLDVERIEAELADMRVEAVVRGHTRVGWYDTEAIVNPGDVVEVSGWLTLLRGFKNPGCFDYERYMHRRGIFTRMFTTGPGMATIEGKGELGPRRRFNNYFRRRGLEIINHATRTDETRAFLSAIVLGERGLLTEEMEDWFKKTGTFHVLAISGLHIGLVYLLVSLALAPLPLGTRGRVAVSIAVVWMYALATGASVSVTRASIMLTIILSGYYLSREGDFLTSVAIAALILVGLDPVIIDDLGFQLSFTAVLLLCTFEPFYSQRLYPQIQKKFGRIPAPILNRLAITAFASLVIGVGMLPLQAYHFNMMSLVFPVANLVVIPLLSFVLAAGFACLLSGFIWLQAATLFGFVAEAFSWTIFAVVRLCSHVPASSVRVASPPLWILGVEALVVLMIWWRPLSVRKRVAFAAATAVMVAASFFSQSPKDVLRVTFIEVGNADACLVEFPSGETMLVDTGFYSVGLDCGEDIIAPFLWKKGITAIDTLVLTHSDNDHTGGVLFLIENFRIGRLWAPDTGRTRVGFEEIFEAMHKRGYPIENLDAADPAVKFGTVRVETLNPMPDAAQHTLSDNNVSLVLRLTHGETDVLLPGDIGSKAVRSMIGLGKSMDAELLKAPHHGLKSGFNREFIELVNPQTVVLSGGAFHYKQSMRSRMERYAPFCHTVVSTKDCGAIILESDGHEFALTTTRRSRKKLF
jgi:competence protein ComEC